MEKKSKVKLILIILISIILVAFITFTIISATGVIENEYGKAISKIFNKSDDNKTQNNTNNNTSDNTNTTQETPAIENKEPKYITVGGYTLNLGTYKGRVEQGVWDEETMTSKSKFTDITLVLTEDTITVNEQTAGYTISGSSIKWKAYDFPILEVSGNNKIRYIVEDCPDLVYQED